MKSKIWTIGLIPVALIVSLMIGPVAGTSTAQVGGTDAICTEPLRLDTF